MIDREERAGLDRHGGVTERTGVREGGITELDTARHDVDPSANEERGIAREGGRAGAEVQQGTRAAEDARDGRAIRAVNLENGVGRNVHHPRRAGQAARSDFDDAFHDIEAARILTGTRQRHLTGAHLIDLELAVAETGAVDVIDKDTGESEIAPITDRKVGLSVTRIGHEAAAGQLGDSNIAVVEIEPRARAHHERGRRGNRGTIGHPENPAGDRDLVVIEIIDARELQDAVPRLGQRDTGARGHRGRHIPRNRRRDGRAGDGERLRGETERHRPREREVVRGDVTAESEIRIDRDGVDENARHAIAQQVTAINDQGAGADGSHRRQRARGRLPIGTDHDTARVQREITGKGILAGQGE